MATSSPDRATSKAPIMEQFASSKKQRTPSTTRHELDRTEATRAADDINPQPAPTTQTPEPSSTSGTPPRSRGLESPTPSSSFKFTQEQDGHPPPVAEPEHTAATRVEGRAVAQAAPVAHKFGFSSTPHGALRQPHKLESTTTSSAFKSFSTLSIGTPSGGTTQPFSAFAATASSTSCWTPMDSGPRRPLQDLKFISSPPSTQFRDLSMSSAPAQRSLNSTSHLGTFFSAAVQPIHTTIRTMDLFGNSIEPMIDHLSRLPAELRNEIHHHVLFCDKKVFDIREPFPPITRVCKQMRAESMPLFLGTGKFRATVVDRKTGRLPSWLDIFAGFDDSMKRAFCHLHVCCKGVLLEADTVSGCSHTAEYQLLYPDYETWHGLLVQVKHAGLTGKQVTIESHFFEEVKECIERACGDRAMILNDIDDALTKDGGHSHLFSRFIIRSLLRLHGLFDAQAPTPDVFHFLLGVPGFEDDETRATLEKALDREAKTVMTMCRVPPELWFMEWSKHTVAKSKQLCDVVLEELKRLKQEVIESLRRSRAADAKKGLPKYDAATAEALSRSYSLRRCEQCV